VSAPGLRRWAWRLIAGSPGGCCIDPGSMLPDAARPASAAGAAARCLPLPPGRAQHHLPSPLTSACCCCATRGPSRRTRLAGFVGVLVAANTLLNPGADLQRSLAGAIAVFVFNILYEVTLGQKLKQYAMCPVIDLANHSSTGTVRRRQAVDMAFLAAPCRRGVPAPASG